MSGGRMTNERIKLGFTGEKKKAAAFCGKRRGRG
jgi:hypothetical protein